MQIHRRAIHFRVLAALVCAAGWAPTHHTSAQSGVAPEAPKVEATRPSAVTASPELVPVAPAAATASPGLVPLRALPPTPAPVLGETSAGFPLPAEIPATGSAAQAATVPPTAATVSTLPYASGLVPVGLPRGADQGAVVHFRPGEGLEVTSTDGRFSLTTHLLGQFLDELHLPTAALSPRRNYLIIPLARVSFDGHVFSPQVKYRLELGFSGTDLDAGPVLSTGRSSQQVVDASGKLLTFTTGSDVIAQSPVLDFFVDFTHLRDANLHVGQGKVPFGRERLIQDGQLGLIARSAVDQEFNFGRDIGVDLRSTDLLGQGKLRYYAGIYSGELRNATRRTVGAGDLGLLYVVRAEFAPFGNFADSPVALQRVASPKLSLGAAYAFLQSDATGPYAQQALGHTLGAADAIPLVDFNAHNFTADALFKLQGLSVLTAFHYRSVSPRGLPGGVRDGLGWTLQGGYMLGQALPLEVVGSYAMVRATQRTTSTIDENDELGFGLNYYVEGHAMKLQADYVHRFSPPGGLGVDNRLRVQFQIAL